jgi:drug/metabolite transporter (DMT)-like permease
MELWIPITIAAAFAQNLRSAAQKHLKSKMGTTGATYVRFLFGMPFVLLVLTILVFGFGFRLPEPGSAFYAWALVGSIAQVAATFLLVHLFSFRNFAVGTAYSRTEPVQAAIFGLVLLGEGISSGVMMAIAISVVGVMLISVAHLPMSLRNLGASLVSPTALTGLASGLLFGISAISYRAASVSLGGPNFVVQGTLTLAFVVTLQVVVMTAWIAWREREEFSRIAIAWKPSLLAGLMGAIASLGWFTAMTLQNAAIVKALAQVEMLFTFAASVFFFKERINHMEVAGCLLIVAGIVVLVLMR